VGRDVTLRLAFAGIVRLLHRLLPQSLAFCVAQCQVGVQRQSVRHAVGFIYVRKHALRVTDKLRQQFFCPDTTN